MESSLPLDYSYLACDQEGKTDLLHSPSEVPINLHSYIRFESPQLSLQPQNLYHDPDFSQARLQSQLFTFPEQDLVLKRLSELHPLGGQLFPKCKKKLVDYNHKVPHFVFEMQLLDVVSFQRLFLHHQITKNGKYQVLVNRNGYFELETIDDFIPVKRKTNVPLWNLDPKQPWQLLVTKIWAKKNGSYSSIQMTHPFEFIQYFTPCTWRQINISHEGRSFLHRYSKKLGVTCQIFLKTKNDKEVERSGLIPGTYCYELIEFDEFEELGKKQYNLLIKSVVPHQWTGNLSIFDQNFKQTLTRLKNPYQLQSTFLMDQPDFFNIFSSAYVTSARISFPSFITCHRFTVEAQNKNPFFFELNVNTQGYLLLTIRQSQQNKKGGGGLFYIRTSEEKRAVFNSVKKYEVNEKYLEVKYLLSKITFGRKNQAGNGKRSNSNFKNKLNYLLFDFDYSKGLNKGECHPLAIQPGSYILRIQTELSLKQSTFSIQIISHEHINIAPFEPHPTVQETFFKDSLLSIAHKVPTQKLQEGAALISFGKEFQTMGYGFVVVTTKSSLKGTLLVKVNPELLRKEGYQLIVSHSSKRQEFCVEVKAQQEQVFILKALLEQQNVQRWPPEAFKFYISKPK